MYVRVELREVPCELVDRFDPHYPLVLGGLLPMEESLAFLQLRFKKHRWHPKILKTKDPIILSMGWRRFQTLPLYAMQDHNMRNRMLKYTPEHMHCIASIYGPVTPPNTGCLAILSVTDRSTVRAQQTCADITAAVRRCAQGSARVTAVVSVLSHTGILLQTETKALA